MKVEIVKEGLKNFRGYTVLFKAPRKVKIGDNLETEYFVASRVNTYFFMNDGIMLYQETLVFPANRRGKVLSWVEIAGGRGMGIYDAIENFERIYLEGTE